MVPRRLAQSARRRSCSMARCSCISCWRCWRSIAGARWSCRPREARAGRARAADPAAYRRACRRHAPASRTVPASRTPTNSWCARCGSRRPLSAPAGHRAGRDLGAWLPRPLFLAALPAAGIPRAAPWLLIVAVLLPVLALLGFAHAGQTVAAMGPPTADAIDPALSRRGARHQGPRRPGRLSGLRRACCRGAGRCASLRDRRERRNLIEVRYPGGQVGAHPQGIQRARGEPHRRHPALLGMRRPWPLLDLPRQGDRRPRRPAATPARSNRRRSHRISAEARCAARLPASADRRPQGDAAAGAAPRAGPAGRRAHRQRPAASRMSRCCSATSAASPSLADQRLPFDIVFLLNRYFRRSSARPSRRPAAGSTSSSAMARWRCSA